VTNTGFRLFDAFDDLDKKGYAGSMDNKILFVQSAFKHGFTRADIQKAIETKIYDGPFENQDN
jgi:hypothetical protein